MAIGPAPDWTQVTWLIGNYEGTPTLVAVDDQGRLYAVLYGTISVEGEVDVTQAEKDREIQGSDGATLRTIAVDELGRIITLIKGVHNGTLTPVAVDAGGQIYTLVKGSGGEDIAVDAAGNLSAVMKGIDGVTLRTVAVDEDGNIVGVFKGLYDTTLKTLKVDADGRLIAVLSDPADVWGTFREMGLAEVAAILTPCNRYDRRGDIIFWDSFENGLVGWGNIKFGTGAEVTHSARYSRNGAFSVKVAPGSVANDYALIFRFLPYSKLSTGGFEISFNYGSSISLAGIWYRLYDSTNYYEGRLEWDLPNTTLKYYDSEGNYQDLLTGLNTYTGPDLFHTLKLVIDWNTKKYVRGFFNEHEVDMSAYSLYSTASALAPHIKCFFSVISAGGASHPCWVDDAIITTNEPANP